MSVGIKATFNKFAFLTVQDSDSDTPPEGNVVKGKKQPTKSATTDNNSKKRSRRQKKKENAGGKQTAKNNPSRNGKMKSPRSSTQDVWAKKDEDLVAKMYQDDMWRAIELSKQEHEKQLHLNANQSTPKGEANSVHNVTTEKNKHDEPSVKKAERKEKKHKEKGSKTISLEEFHQQVEKSLSVEPGSPKREKKSQTKRTHKIPNKADGSGDFFGDIDKEVDDIQRKEKSRDRQASTSSTSNPVNMESHLINKRLNEQLNEKDELIENLNEQLQSWEEKYNHVKKRNKQLLIMLQQGEMKEKAELLLEVERLSIIRDQLTNEVSDMHQNLEKERSKASKLKDELTKASAKQGKKHVEG